ncbi:hypothetical protein Ahy_A10g049731 isoform A [Arachis hypogaea]|uniref:N-end rule aminoacyl transferase C-terminal domain-containing protein n=1 Tax=Arachis hypogaea TaxID=3818 RepID=A0A445B7T6_ARAHY|nr:hypothetical protein Ahy_A10g049731 isoform A [Arachis hypogaea]
MLIEKGEFPSHIVLPKPLVRKVSQGKKKLLASGSEDMLYSSNIAFHIAASRKRSHSGDKNRNNSQPSQNGEKKNASSPKIIVEKLVVPLDPMVKSSGLSFRACNGHINFSAPTERVCQSESVQSAETSKKSGMKCDISGNYLTSPQHCQVKSKSDINSKYIVINQTMSQTSYRRFLVDTPLLFVSPTGDSTVPPCCFGSFHQQYLIDGKLVAVSVIDVLPKCLLFLPITRQVLNTSRNRLGERKPACIISRWVPFDITRPLLDKRLYVVLSDSSVLKNGNSFLPQATEDS